MSARRANLLHFLLFAAATATFEPVKTMAADNDILATLRPGHPRLYVTDDELPRVRQFIASDPLARQWHESLRISATKMLDEPVAKHELVGPRMLQQSRAALRRISTLAGMFRLDGDPRFADRARKEMLALADFPDWNPQAFLDVAECGNAMAIGYDWLFSQLSPEDRKKIRSALLEKGLNEGLKAYFAGVWWTTADFNYAQVCGGGLTAAALAIADEEPTVAARILTLTRRTLARPMSRFAPDGGWSEGPMYWNYATRYNVFYLSAVTSALGTDFGLGESPGFADTGLFRIHSIGPTGLCFNYGDGSDRTDPSPQMFWLARRFNRPMDAAFERAMAKNSPDIFDLFWFDSFGQWPVRDVPTCKQFRGINVAFLRGAWNDSDATFVGFKGGDNRANHSHLDLGTFVLDALGERWAVDLGSDNYDLPGYFREHRWEYYRLRTEGHNTLTLDDCNQNPQAKAPLIGFGCEKDRSFAIADLTDAYKVASRVWRGMALIDARRVLVQDEIELHRPAIIVWNFHTRAQVKIAAGGRQAVLSFGEKRLEARLLSPTDAAFEIISADAPPPQGRQIDVKNVIIRLKEGPRSTRIAVVFSPIDSGELHANLEPLEQWSSAKK